MFPGEGFLEHFMFEGGQLGIAVGHPSRLKLHEDLPTDLPSNQDVYFTPALRDNGGTDKVDVVGSRAVWVDVDDNRLPRTTFPPSCIVNSGHGFHLYWFLKDTIAKVAVIEAVNRSILQDIPTGDKASWNANRVLRVPWTINSKSPPMEVKLVNIDPSLTYSLADFNALARLDKKVRHKIKTGDRRGYKSRSERDWAVVSSLVEAGASDILIELLFRTQPVGDKVKDPATHDGYLSRTIERARSSFTEKVTTQELEEKEDGYYLNTKRGPRRISTFTIAPKLLLDGSAFSAQDAIVGDVTASGYVWENITFSRGAFTSIRKLDAETPVAAWQWLGYDTDVRKLLPFLMEDLQSNGLPRVVASPVLGLHTVDDKRMFIGDAQTLSADELWNDYGGPAAWLPSKKEHPELELSTKLSKSDLKTIRTLVPKLNAPDSLWPMLGWYASSPMKPWLEENGYRFPILNVTGSRGSGKTTLIQRVMMPLFGQSDPKSYDAGTTKFVILSLLGSSNAVPIAFSEFRYESVEKFLRYVLLSYDTGHDPRGRPDQTTVDYPLIAPFSLDGEDLITDPAARQRVVVVLLKTATIDEGSEAYDAFNQLRTKLPRTFGGYYIRQLLTSMEDGSLARVLEISKNAMFAAFPSKLPDRVRNNHIVAYAGVLKWCEVVGLEPPSALVMAQSINAVYDTKVGRGRMLVDDMVEDIVNECAAATQRFKWEYDADTYTVWFQMATAHSWWTEKRRRQGRGALERDSLRQQLSEVEYAIPGANRNGTWMYGIRLKDAVTAQLDVPDEIKVGVFTLHV